MSFGGYSPHPRQLGGGSGIIQALSTSLSEGRGSHISKSSTSAVWVENNAIARAIWGLWATNQRLAFIWNPIKCPVEILERWETMLSLVRDPADTVLSRRARLAHKFSLFGRNPDFGLMYEEIDTAIGDMFVDLTTIAPSVAVMHIPPTGSWPWGTNVTGTVWSSTTFRYHVRVQKFAGQSEADFYDRMGALVRALDAVLPAWLGLIWYRAPTDYAPISVSGGPSGAGFYLDDVHNVDNCVFDV